MSKKNKKKLNWFKTLLLVILAPLAAWILAFLLWLYWYDIKAALAPHKEPPKAMPKAATKDGPERTLTKKPGDERILEEDRRKLETILEEKGR